MVVNSPLAATVPGDELDDIVQTPCTPLRYATAAASPSVVTSIAADTERDGR